MHDRSTPSESNYLLQLTSRVRITVRSVEETRVFSRIIMRFHIRRRYYSEVRIRTEGKRLLNLNLKLDEVVRNCGQGMKIVEMIYISTDD